jgi:hypothetical protein
MQRPAIKVLNVRKVVHRFGFFKLLLCKEFHYPSVHVFNEYHFPTLCPRKVGQQVLNRWEGIAYRLSTAVGEARTFSVHLM